MVTMEEIIDTWSLLYVAPDGVKYNGKCTVTRDNIYYDVKPANGRVEINGNNKLIREVKIEKLRIKKVKVKRLLFSRKIVVVMENGEQHIFCSRGFWTARIVAAINTRQGL